MWSSMLSTRTGWKVPAPTCSVTNAISTPFSRSFASSGSSKCRPAVGAATAPGFSLYTVWYSSRSASSSGRSMYGGSGIWPIALRISSTLRASSNATSNSASWRATMVALMLSSSPSSSSAPGFGALEARICARIRLSSSMRSTSTSILPPLALRPNRRAGITRVLLKTSRSPGLSLSSKSVKVPCVSAPVGPSNDSKRQLLRSGMG